MDFLIKASQLLLSLSILVFLHELGHFIPARIFKTRVEKFYLFFNPWFSIFKKKIGDTEWGIGWLPLGGFVKISGMIDESMDKEQMAQPAQPWEFRSKPAWQRLIIMIGGVTVNLILGFLIYILVLFTWGEEQLHTKDLENGLAIHPILAQYNLHSGDNILAVNDAEVLNPMDINKGVLIRDNYNLKVEHKDGSIENIELPDGIEYDLFEAGAMNAFSLRHKSTGVLYVNTQRSISNSTQELIPAGAGIIAIDDKLLKEYPSNLSYRDFMNNEAVSITYNYKNDTLTSSIPGNKMQSFFNATPALRNGLRPGDNILTLNGEKIIYFDQITDVCFNNKGKEITATVLRNGDTLSISPKIT
ncbi:MAG: site-2 protease family protein, partial [Crocinitomicaceae bacterium]|nr:site-2 protease family protein [Crocinitomicaceae bacterium]